MESKLDNTPNEAPDPNALWKIEEFRTADGRRVEHFTPVTNEGVLDADPDREPFYIGRAVVIDGATQRKAEISFPIPADNLRVPLPSFLTLRRKQCAKSSVNSPGK